MALTASSQMTLCEAFEALVCWRAMPAFVLRKPKVSLSAVGVTLLASRMPSAVKYHSSTYSMILILSRANCAGKKGSLFGTKASSSKSGKVVFFLIGKICQEIGLVALMFFFELLFPYVSSSISFYVSLTNLFSIISFPYLLIT